MDEPCDEYVQRSSSKPFANDIMGFEEVYKRICIIKYWLSLQNP
jgi:hypothetical protein